MNSNNEKMVMDTSMKYEKAFVAIKKDDDIRKYNKYVGKYWNSENSCWEE